MWQWLECVENGRVNGMHTGPSSYMGWHTKEPENRDEKASCMAYCNPPDPH